MTIILAFKMSQITFKRGYLATQPYYILPKKTCYLSQVAYGNIKIIWNKYIFFNNIIV